jgi:transcriptional regulator with XRE-family HTH domain
MMTKNSYLPDLIIARNLIRLREERGWSQEDLAGKYGCTFQYISQMETGHRGFGKQTLPKLAKALGVTQKELLEMPKDLSSKELGEQWEKFRELAGSDNADLFERVLNLFSEAEPGAIKTLDGIITIIEKQRGQP